MCVSQTFLQVTLLIYLLAQATSFSRAVPDAVHSPYGCSFPHLNLNLKLSIFIFIPFSISQEQYHSLFQGVLRVYIISFSKSQPLNQSLLNSRLCLTVISYLSISISTSYPASIHTVCLCGIPDFNLFHCKYYSQSPYKRFSKFL